MLDATLISGARGRLIRRDVVPGVRRFESGCTALGETQYDVFTAAAPFVIDGLGRLQADGSCVVVQNPQGGRELREVSNVDTLDAKRLCATGPPEVDEIKPEKGDS